MDNARNNFFFTEKNGNWQKSINVQWFKDTKIQNYQNHNSQNDK